MRNELWKNPLSVLHGIYKDLTALPQTIASLGASFGAKTMEHSGIIAASSSPQAAAIAKKFLAITSPVAESLVASQSPIAKGLVAGVNAVIDFVNNRRPPNSGVAARVGNPELTPGS